MNQLEHPHSYLDDFLIALSHGKKISKRYLLIFFPAVISLGMICFIGNGSSAGVWLKIFQLLGFSLAGLFFLYQIKKNISFDYIFLLGERIVYTLSVSAIICVILLFFYLLTYRSLALMALASSAAFAIPHVVLKAWNYYKSIPEKQFAVWIQPVSLNRMDEIFWPESLNITFSITKRYFDTSEELYMKQIVSHAKLGHMFYAILREENKSNRIVIEYADKNLIPYGWEFYVTTFKGLVKKRLDPEKSLWENGLPDKSIIIVKRVKQNIV